MKIGEVYSMLGMDFAQFNKDERTAKRRTETLGSSLSGVLKNAFSFTLGMGFFSAVQTGFRSTVGTMISFNAQMEQAQIGFTTMLGSAQRAKRFLDDVAKFAAKTPFEFPDLLDASKRMLAYGFAAEDVLPTMEAVGNATVAVGLGAQGINRIILALGQMRAKGKVSGEEMRQLTETGIPAWEILAEAMGKSTAEVMDLSQRGLIPAEQAIKMFTEGMNKRFPGMMSKMENTWEGVTSTIKDVWQMTIGEVTKGLFQGAVSWLQKVRDVATGFYDAFRAGGLQYAIEQTFGAGVAASVNIMIATLKGLWGVVSGVSRFIIRHWTTIRTVVLGAAWAFLAFKTINAVLNATTWATNVLATVTKILSGEAVKTSLTTGFLARAIQTYNLQLHYASMAGIAHVGVLRTLSTALYSLWHALGPIGWAIMAITAALSVGTVVWSKYNQAVQSAAQKAQTDKMAQQQQEYMGAVTEAAKGTEAQADALKEMGKAASKNLQSFDEVHTLMEDVADATLGGPALDAGVTAPAIPEMELPDFSFDMEAAIAGAKADMGGFWGWLKQSASEAWGSVKTWGSNLWEGVKGGWAGFKTYASGFWENLKTAGGQAWNTIKTDASNLWEGAKGAWGSFKDWATGHWESILQLSHGSSAVDTGL
ncbi:MAG TPA: tape measure protein [Firmicutes bacterium]|nr:tape measure protein [Candidatus Fermentithermobacillaceae bacterium]